MSILAVKTSLYSAIWALLEANATFTGTAGVPPGSRIKLTGSQSDPSKINKASADFPEAILTYGRWKIADYKANQRFVYAAGGAPVGIVNELEQWFQLVITHRDMRADVNDLLDVATVTALRASGPGLGLMPATFGYVLRGDIDVNSAYGITEESPGIRRAQSSFTFPVTVRWKGQALPTQTT